MFFAHIADCHLGGWRDPALRQLNHKAFETAIQRCIHEKVDFVLIAGDLFNTAIPSIDSIRVAFEELRQLKEAGIPTYFIAGSHDCSATNRSVLDVIESAGLGTNVSRGEAGADGTLRLVPVVDPKTGVKLCGLLGRRGGLEKHYYEALDRSSLETLAGPKIFLFHGSIAELKPDELQDMDAFGISLMPRGFDYYAGGHIHIVRQHSMPGYLNVVYPGPTFPNNFAELEKLGAGSFCLVRDWQVEHVSIGLHPVVSVTVSVEGKNPPEAEAAIRAALPPRAEGAIVLLRVEGTLRQGSVADIRFNELLGGLEGALTVLRNTSALRAQEFEDVALSDAGSLEDIEDRLAREHAGKSHLDAHKEIAITKELLRALATERKDGEKVADFEQRVRAESSPLLNP